jgi:hypothetical protein
MPEPAEKPTRSRWFQFHLSTAMVVMVVAGLLVWANAIKQNYGIIETYGPALGILQGHGWPVRHGFWYARWGGHWVIEWPGLLADVAVALAILASVATLCELITQRRFRFHLSTAMVVMFVAAGLLWANLTEQKFEDDLMLFMYRNYGFPIRYGRRWLEPWGGKWVIEWPRLLSDIVIAILILGAVAFVCERIIRRKKYG